MKFERPTAIEQPDVVLVDKVGQRMLTLLTEVTLVLHGVQKKNPIDAGIFGGKRILSERAFSACVNAPLFLSLPYRTPLYLIPLQFGDFDPICEPNAISSRKHACKHRNQTFIQEDKT